MLARVSDGLLLVETMDSFDRMDEMRRHGKRIIQSLNQSSHSPVSTEVGQCFFHYIINAGIVYLCLTEKGYPRKLAFQYLNRLAELFNHQHGHEVHSFSRPYAAVVFGPQMQRLRREFMDPQTPDNAQKLASDLNEITNIMSQSITQIVHRGQNLEKLQEGTDALRYEAKKFRSKSKHINLQAQLKQMAPIAVMLMVVCFVIYWKFF